LTLSSKQGVALKKGDILELSSAQLDEFRKNGFLLIRNL